MASLVSGNATPEKRKGRAVLSPHGPLIEIALASAQIDDFIIPEELRLSNNLWPDPHLDGALDRFTDTAGEALLAARRFVQGLGAFAPVRLDGDA